MNPFRKWIVKMFGSSRIRPITQHDVQPAKVQDPNLERQLSAGTELLHSYIGRAERSVAAAQEKFAADAAAALRRR